MLPKAYHDDNARLSIMTSANLALAAMRRDEADILGQWAADEDWNPGKADIAIAWDTDPDAFIVLRRGAELAGGGTIFSYGGAFGFMGLFIVRRDLRSAGLGAKLWRHRLELLRSRLAAHPSEWTASLRWYLSMSEADLRSRTKTFVLKASRAGKWIAVSGGLIRRASRSSIVSIAHISLFRGLHFSSAGYFRMAPMQQGCSRKTSSRDTASRAPRAPVTKSARCSPREPTSRYVSSPA